MLDKKYMLDLYNLNIW